MQRYQNLGIASSLRYYLFGDQISQKEYNKARRGFLGIILLFLKQ